MKTSLYILYLKDSNEIYAMTSDKTEVITFLNQRNPDKFNLKVLKIGMKKSLKYKNLYRNKLLQNIPINDNPFSSFEILATNEEYDKLHYEADKITQEIQDIQRQLSKINFCKKDEKSINNITHIYLEVIKSDKKDLYSTINLFALFTSLFKETF